MFKVTAIYANSWKSQKLAIRISYLNSYKNLHLGKLTLLMNSRYLPKNLVSLTLSRPIPYVVLFFELCTTPIALHIRRQV